MEVDPKRRAIVQSRGRANRWLAESQFGSCKIGLFEKD
jgi:hypothetical protein